jgi:hypothetical protein
VRDQSADLGTAPHPALATCGLGVTQPATSAEQTDIGKNILLIAAPSGNTFELF